jgi:hypothetical protein
MTTPHIVDPAGLLGEALAQASPGVMRQLLQTMINALLSADADAVVGAEGASPFRPDRATQRVPPLLAQVARYEAVGLFGPRDFDKYAFQIDIPLYDPSEPSHRELAQFGCRGRGRGRTVQLSADIRFVDARSRVSGHSRAVGILPTIEAAVTTLPPPS